MARLELDRMAEGRKGLLGLAGGGSSVGGGLSTLGGGGGSSGSGSTHQRSGAGAGTTLTSRLGSVVGGLMPWGHPTTPADTIRVVEAEVRALESLHRYAARQVLY